MKVNFYINFDLGLNRDVKGLFKWLDKNNAVEKGNGHALIKNYNFPEEEFQNEIEGEKNSLTFVNHLRKEIKKTVKIEAADRIYLTFKTFETNDLYGVFLFGEKKPAPWRGYSLIEKESKIDLEV